MEQRKCARVVHRAQSDMKQMLILSVDCFGYNCMLIDISCMELPV